MWNDLSNIWQVALENLWESYKNGSVPIAAVMVDENDNIIKVSRNQISEEIEDNQLSNTNMAHAEMNLLKGLKKSEHPNIKKYKLYTTMEPCPMCLGTLVMMNIRHVVYGSRDAYAGAIKLSQDLEYIKSKNIIFEKGPEEIEVFQLIMQSAFEYNRPNVAEPILNSFRKTNHLAVDCAYEQHKAGYFSKAIENNLTMPELYDYIMGKYMEKSTCPICGKNNKCTHSNNCWCHTTKVSKKVIDMVPQDKKGKACICKECVEKYKD